jgi:hypothetical protein
VAYGEPVVECDRTLAYAPAWGEILDGQISSRALHTKLRDKGNRTSVSSTPITVNLSSTLQFGPAAPMSGWSIEAVSDIDRFLVSDGMGPSSVGIGRDYRAESSTTASESVGEWRPAIMLSGTRGQGAGPDLLSYFHPLAGVRRSSPAPRAS